MAKLAASGLVYHGMELLGGGAVLAGLVLGAGDQHAVQAGQVVGGFSKVEAALREHEVLALIHASDAAGDGRRKLNAALHRKTREKPREIAIVDIFSGGQLDLALNRPNVVHAALLAGPASETFLARAKRLQSFRNSPANAPADGA